MGMDLTKERKAIEILKCFEPEQEPYYLCYSGGKDSDCIRLLAQLSGVDVLKWWVQDDYSQLRFFEEEYLKNISDDLYTEI